MRALKMEFRSSFRLIPWIGGTAALILTTLLMGCTPRSDEYFWGDKQPVLDLNVPRPLDEASGSFDGEWSLSGIRSSAHTPLRIRWNRRSDGDRIEMYSSLSAGRLRSLIGGFRSGEVSTIESEAGELTLKVQKWSSMSSRVSGTWRFDMNPAYARRAAELLRSKPDESQWLQLLFAEVNTWYMAALYDATVEKPTVDELLRARWNGVSEDYLEDISRIGARFHPEDIIRLRQHGVSGDFLASAVAVDRQFTVDQIIRLRQHGISGDFLASVVAVDRQFTVDQIIQLRQHGVSANFLESVRQTDPWITVDKIVQMRQHGVSEEFFAIAKTIDSLLTVDEIVKMRQHGVTTDFFADIKHIETSYSTDDIIRLRQHGVDGDYIKALYVPGRAPLDADTIIHLRQRGVDAETARKLRE